MGTFEFKVLTDHSEGVVEISTDSQKDSKLKWAHQYYIGLLK